MTPSAVRDAQRRTVHLLALAPSTLATVGIVQDVDTARLWLILELAAMDDGDFVDIVRLLRGQYFDEHDRGGPSGVALRRLFDAMDMYARDGRLPLAEP